MILIREVKLPIGADISKLNKKISVALKLDQLSKKGPVPFFSVEIIRKSIDARKKPDIFYSYTCLVDFKNDEQRIRDHIIRKGVKNVSFDVPKEYVIPECGNDELDKRPVIIGSGPCGIFAAYLLAQKGFCPIVIERGEAVKDRNKTVNAFFEGGPLNTESNIQFGEGGAGTFSDGKLATSTKDKTGRGDYVLRTYYKFGANRDITIDAKPHIGTDILMNVVENMRNDIISMGGSFFFNTKLEEIVTKNNSIKSIKVRDNNTREIKSFETDILVLAIGHSARDTFKMIYSKGILMQQKNFAVGFRVIHPQGYVDKWQYGVEYAADINLKSADYKVTNEASNSRNVYSFCMCPGGYVVNASSENEMICVNGMSENKRDSGWANSAIVCGITPDDFVQTEVPKEHPLSGMYYQKEIEKKCFVRGDGNIPVQLFAEYEQSCKEKYNICDSAEHNHLQMSLIQDDNLPIKGLIKYSDLSGIYSEAIDVAILESIHRFGYTREGFDEGNVLLCGVEARTSSPVRINRDENLESNIKGIYPGGEGAGYAGGITSAAMDGMRIAEKIIEKYTPAYERN